MAPKIVLHHLNTSRSGRIFWALEELGLPYDVKVYLRLPTRSAPPELLKVSPFGKAPVLELGDEVLTESAYIIQRLLGVNPNADVDVELVPSNDSIFWSNFAEGSQMNLFQAGAIIGATGAAWAGGAAGDLSDEGKQAISKYTGWLNEGYLRPQNQNNLDQIEDFLTKNSGKFFSGTDKPGLGDFMLWFALDSLIAGGRKDAGYKIGPNTQKWYETVSARPAYKRAVERLAKEEAAAKAKI